MTKQEHIDEMGKVMPEKIKHPLDNSKYTIFGKSLRREIARIYYNAGYRKIDEFAKCRDCTAWSGTDCTRHPYTQGYLKDENNIKWQAVKEFTDKLKIKLFEFFKDNEELDGKISVGPLYVDVIGVEANVYNFFQILS